MKLNGRPRAVVAGGAGFLGSHLCSRLLAEGYAVYCLDNFLTGRMENLRSLERDPHLEVIEQDVIEPLPASLNVHEVYNLACPASPPHYQRDPIETVKTSVLGTLALLEFASLRKVRFLQASTSEVYGDPKEHPQRESYWGHVNPIGVRACYDEGKRCAETLCFDFSRRRGLPIRVARIFNTYGPCMRADDGRIISNVVSQAISGEAITIYGDGGQTRSFCYVDDLIEGLFRLMLVQDYAAGPVNLGNPDERSIADLVQSVIRLTGSRSEIVYKPLPLDDPKRRRPDISRAKELLGWEPRTSLDQGLARTIAWFQSAGTSAAPTIGRQNLDAGEPTGVV